MQRLKVGTGLVCALSMLALATPAWGKTGTAIRFQVVDAQDQPLSGATVRVLSESGKSTTPLVQLNKNTWLIKDPSAKMLLDVYVGRSGGAVEMALPGGDDIVEATFRVRVSAGFAVSELVSTTSARPKANQKEPPTYLPTRVGQASAQAGPPANDDCANAESIAVGGMATGSTVTATDDSAPTCGTSNSGPGVWYKVVGDGTTLTASLCGSDFDTKLTVFCNTCTEPLCVGGNDDAFGVCSPQSEVSWCSESGTEYLILVHGFLGDTGNYELNVTSDTIACAGAPDCVVDPPPANDLCTDAESISIGGTASGATNDATTDGAPFCGTSNSAPGVWYSVIGDGNTLTAELCNSDYDTKLTVYCNSCADPLCVGGNDDSCGAQSLVSWCSESGREYLILVHGFSSGVGNYELNVTTDGAACANPPDCAPPSGACCVAGSCDATNTLDECNTLGGTWFDGESCPAFACPGACAGDDCGSAALVGSVPFSDTGNTCTCTDDYDEVCPFNTPGSPDVVYSYTPAQDECVNISLCNGSAYDTKLYVYENTCGGFQSGTAFACNDDSCPGFVSELTNVFLSSGNTYFIVIDGYDGDCGDYVLDITPCGPACDVVCDKNGTSENEPDCFDGFDDTTNGGCNNITPVFTDVMCGDTICGTGGTYLGELPCLSDLDCPFGEICSASICTGGPYELRDTDWYRITLGSDQEITMIVEAEFPVLAGIVDTGGVDDCGGVSAFLASGTGDACDPVTLTDCVGAGTWYLFVAPSAFSGIPCGGEYQLDIICDNCPLGACCFPDGSCAPDQTEPSCVVAGGEWQGEGVGCTPNPCPQPQLNDECDGAIAVGVPSTTAGTTDGATTDTGFPSPCGSASITSPGVWYEVTGTGNTMTASLCNGATNFDSKISVFCPSCTEAVCVDGNDDFCGVQSEVSWCSESGQAYQILVHGFGGQTGPFELVVSDDGNACPNPVSCTLCPGDGDCCDPAGNGTPGCDDEECCNIICACDPFCCDVFWDSACATTGFLDSGCGAEVLCPGCQPLPPTGACCDGLTCSIQFEADCQPPLRYLGDDTVCDGGGAGMPTTYEEDVNLDIPDNGTPANPITRTLNVPDSFSVGDVNVDLVVSHTWVGDLIVSLEHNGTEVVIIDRMGVPASGFGCGEDNLDIILDDQGTGGLIEDQCSPGLSSPPNYRPENPLSAWNGMDSAGDWILRVSDNASFDTGTLDHWSLHIDLPGGNPCIPTGACCLFPDSCEIRTQESCENSSGVYLGDDSSCEAVGATTVYQQDVNEAIPDNGTPANPVSNTINVPDSYTLADVDIDLVVDHTWVGDLIVTVTHGATSVTVVDRMGVPASGFGCGEDNLNIVLDDEGSGGAIENQCSPDLSSPPNYTPENALSAFNGLDASGDWTIEVSDNADFDTGSLVSWSVHATATGPDPCEGAFLGACCDGNTGGCTNDEFEADCTGDVQLSWHQGQDCDELDPPCEQHRGACCDGLTGVCTDDILPQNCEGFQQVWSKGELCSAVSCVAATGACCDTTPFEGGCVDGVTMANCQGSKSTWYKDLFCNDPSITCTDNAIPTVSTWGMVVMVLLLLIASKVYFGYRRFELEGGR